MLPERVFAIDRPEISGLLMAGMPEHWHQAGCLKFNRDLSESILSSLDYKLWNIAVKMKIKYNWKTKKGDAGKAMLRQLGHLAICEMHAPGRFNTPNAWELRAAFIGVSKSAWFSTWAGRYKVLFDEFNEWTNRAYRYIKVRAKRLFKDANEITRSIAANEEVWMEAEFRRVV